MPRAKSKAATSAPRSVPLQGGKAAPPSGKAAKEKSKKEVTIPKGALTLDKEMKHLRKLVQGKESDLTSISITRAFLGSALEAVKIAEGEYRRNPHSHNSYALNGLYNQVRELAADLRALETVNENRSETVSNVVHTVMKRFGFQIIQQINLIKGVAETLDGKSRKKVQAVCDKAGVTIAEIISASAQSIIEEVNSQDAPSEPSSVKRKKR